MATIIAIKSLEEEALKPYCQLTDAQLQRDGEVFIAETPRVIERAQSQGYEPLSFLCEEKRASEALALLTDGQDVPVYVGDRATVSQLTGYKLTRGVLCAMRRKPLPSLAEICRGARRIAVMDQLCDTTNIGAIFRSAAALGLDAVVLTRGTCDPLNRRSIRVSMGSVFLVPWTWTESANDLQQMGFRTVAMALTEQSISLDAPQLKQEERLAIIVGTEGDGLTHETQHAADYVVRIPMYHEVDSLNVAIAAALAFWELRVL